MYYSAGTEANDWDCTTTRMVTNTLVKRERSRRGIAAFYRFCPSTRLPDEQDETKARIHFVLNISYLSMRKKVLNDFEIKNCQASSCDMIVYLNIYQENNASDASLEKIVIVTIL